MADLLFRVELTASFQERLEVIEAFLTEADAAFEFDRLLAELRTTVIPNLRRFPRIGRRYLDQPPQSVEALALLAAIPSMAKQLELRAIYRRTQLLKTKHAAIRKSNAAMLPATLEQVFAVSPVTAN